MSTVPDNKPIVLSGNVARVSIQDTALEASGRRSAVFPALLTGSVQEDAYVARMVLRDQELNWGY